MSRPWTDAEIQLLGTKPDYEIGRLLGRPGNAVWRKRKALGIEAPESLVRKWTKEEDAILLSHPLSEAAKILKRTMDAVTIRRHKLRKAQGIGTRPKLLMHEEAKLRIEVPKYDSKEQEDMVRFVGGPYAPPFVPIGGWLRCEIRGMLQVGGYTNALIPWPTAIGHAKQLILCGDLVKALKTESRLALCFHFGMSPQSVSGYKDRLGIERLTPGSTRLFWRNVNLARTDEARAKMSRQREGRQDVMTPEDRERLRQIQMRPKSKEWKAKETERRRRRYAIMGKPEEWTEEELRLIGTRPDREVAKLVNRSLAAVKAKKFQLQKAKEGQASAGSADHGLESGGLGADLSNSRTGL